jgi:glycosyltransferase involved in cell wall biosynthesis
MQKNNELISVIIPVYGVEKYLDKCVLSIINQTYTNLEIILIDDGSPDNCPVICDQYARQDSRIKVIHKINGGLSSARNVGLDIALGKYVTFIDSDDWVIEDYIDILVSAIKKTNSQISVGNTLLVHSKDYIEEKDLKSDETLRIFSPVESVHNMSDLSNGLALPFTTVWGNLYEIELFTNLRFPHGKNNEDEFLNYKLFFLAKRIVYSPKYIYFYLVRNGSILNSEFTISRLVKLEALEERILFFDNLSEKALKNEALYNYYHSLLSYFFIVKKIFPEEKLIYESLFVKYRKTGIKLFFERQINSKKRFVVVLYLLFPKLYRFR